MGEWWRDTDTEICLLHIPVGGGESHVLTLHGREIEGQWEYAIVQHWHRSATLWLSWRSLEVLESSPDLNVQIASP